jgi:hypothetical protein
VVDFDKGLSEALAEALVASKAAVASSQSATVPAPARVAASNDDDDADIFKYQGVVLRGNQLIGEVVNSDTRARSAILRVTFYDAEDVIVGTDTTSIIDARPGRPSTFTFHDVPSHSKNRLEATYLD